MVFVKPFNKEHERIFRHLMKNNIAYTNDIKLSRSFGRHYTDVIDRGWMDIARITKKNKSIIAIPPNIRIVPKQKRFYFFLID